jgi:hypothetical protein
VRAELSKAVDFIEDLHLADLVGSEIEIVELPEEPAGLAWSDEDDGDGEGQA